MSSWAVQATIRSQPQIGGSFDGGTGNDFVSNLVGGTVNGGPGADTVGVPVGDTFNQD